ncbi:Suppressor of the cold-sensitive snRNP biogenesis mutant brr1-1 [Conglomerata obtusa]
MQKEDELIEYEEKQPQKTPQIKLVSTSYFKDFLLRDELNQSLLDVQFEHPSEVQQQCIPKAILSADILCQAKSGTGKTAVFVLASLHQVTPIENETSILVLVHTKELAHQVKNEYKRFVNHLPKISVEDFYGGRSIEEDLKRLENGSPTVFIGTAGRTLDLLNRRMVHFRHVKHFIIDEVDECLFNIEMRYDIQRIFYKTPLAKQTMFFTATLNEEMKKLCLQFLRDPHVVLVGEESKLTLHGLNQSYVIVEEKNKVGALENILDGTEFTQMVIFVNDKFRARNLSDILARKGFPTVSIHSDLKTEERMERYKRFKDVKERILITTNLMARGMDFQDVNLVVNYDMPDCAETYLHRVGRAGRFETKGTAITFVETAADTTVLNDVQSRFEVSINNIS